jgi:hypothetical protein
MFYLTQSVEKGPPKKGCLAPFIDDLASLSGNLGDAMVASAVFFNLMIFFVFPICCFKRLDADSVKPFEGGAAIEMKGNKVENFDEHQNNTRNVDTTHATMMQRDVDF